MPVEPNHFQLLLVLLVVAYKGWEFLRNAARKKSEEARNVPVPADLEDMPWEDRPESVPTPQEHTRPEVLRPAEVFSPRHQENVQSVTTNRFPVGSPRTSIQASTAAVTWVPRQAQPHPKLREWMVGQVILGKPLALAPRKPHFPLKP